MARYKITVVYDGTRFKGFQRQAHDCTVQAELEKALKCLGWCGKSILAAGRTDSGVHAAGQVIACDLSWKHSSEALANAMNAYLPDDIAVRNVEMVTDHFHPRYDASSRSYCYQLYLDWKRNPLLDRYAWRMDPEIDCSLLEEAASRLVGTYDYSVFGSAQKPGASTVRTIYRTAWKKTKDGLAFDVTANAFLYHMVRRMVFLQLLVAKGKVSLKQFELGVIRTESLPPGMAPPNGLSLVAVSYTGE